MKRYSKKTKSKIKTAGSRKITEHRLTPKTLLERAHVAMVNADIALALTQRSTLRSFLHQCADSIVRHLGSAFARIWTLNEKENVLEMQASAGMYAHIDGGHARVPVGMYKIGLIAQERKPHLTNKVVGDPRVHDQEWARRERMVAFAGYPLIVEDRLVGVMAMFARKKLTKVVLAALGSVASVVAQSIERKRAEGQIQGQVQSLSLLVGAAQKLVENRSLDSLAQDIVNTVVTSFGFRLAWIGRADPDGRVSPLYWAGDVADYLKRVEIRWDDSPLGRGPAGHAIATGRPVVMDVAKDAEFAPWSEPALAHGYREVAAFPLVRGEKPFGILILYSGETGFFTPERVGLLQTYTHIAAGVLENARLLEETRRNLEQIHALHEVNLAATSSLDLRIVLDLLLDKIELYLPYFALTTVRILNRETGALEAAAFRNISEEEWKAEIPESGRGLSRAVLENQVPMMIVNAPQDPRTRYPQFFRRKGLVSYLVVPLIAKGEGLGTISIFTKEERQFSNEEVEFLSTLAGQAAIAIQNSQLYEQTRKQAVELERANQVKSEFLSVMSHELRTPLNAIVGYTGMVQDGIFGETNAEQQKALEKVVDRSKDLLSMISDILEVSRMEAEAVRMESRDVALGSFLNELRLAYDIPLDQGLVMVWDYPSDLPIMRTDSGKLRHILQNLINNAIKFTARGNVTVSARYLPIIKSVEFSVADTGIGISKEAMPYIFEAFRQGDSSETRSFGGVGVGLHIVKKFAELLQGKVEVESEPGKGSIFKLTFPFMPA